METKTVNVLLVEDDEVDAEAVLRAFKKNRICNPVTVVKNGLEALEVLRNGKCSRPNLVLLDLNMPRMNGIEFLEAVRHDDDLRDLIIFVLTTSDAERDKCAAYDQNVAGYLVKSKVGEDFLHLIEMLGVYWRYVEFPPEKR